MIFFLGEETYGFEDNEGPYAIVERPGHDHIIAQLLVAYVDGNRVANADDLFRILFVLRTNIDPHLMHLKRLIPIVRWGEVNGLTPDNARHGTLVAMDRNPLPTEDGAVYAADGNESNEAVGVDRIDHETDFIHVTGEHDTQIGALVQHVILVTMDIFVDFAREGLHVLFTNPLDLFLKARGAGGG